MKAKYIRHHANYEPPLEYGKSYKVLDVKPEWIMLDLEDGLPFQWWRANCFKLQAEAMATMKNMEQDVAQNAAMPVLRANAGDTVSVSINTNAILNTKELENALQENLKKSSFLNYGA